MSRTLMLLCYNQSPLFPNDTQHWALFLVEKDSPAGTLFHATKESQVLGVTRYRPVPDVEPAYSATLKRSVIVASELELDFATLHPLCEAAAVNRPFDLVVNNCQRFCSEVLRRLVNRGVLTEDQYNQLEAKGFTPIFPL